MAIIILSYHPAWDNDKRDAVCTITGQKSPRCELSHQYREIDECSRLGIFANQAFVN